MACTIIVFSHSEMCSRISLDSNPIPALHVTRRPSPFLLAHMSSLSRGHRHGQTTFYVRTWHYPRVQQVCALIYFPKNLFQHARVICGYVQYFSSKKQCHAVFLSLSRKWFLSSTRAHRKGRGLSR